jgi:hypothetical protein
VTVGLVEPGQLFNDRANQLDWRFSRPFRAGAGACDRESDIANSFNRYPVLLQNNNYGADG